MTEFVKVFCRVRPSFDTATKVILVPLDNTIIKSTADPANPRLHQFHRAFGPDSIQTDVFDSVGRRAVDGCLKGENGTVFAYGQTGSGKTYTMLGNANNEDILKDPSQKGIIPRAVEYLFESLESQANLNPNFKYSVTIKFIELYNEVIFDLLDQAQSKVTLRNDGKSITLMGANVEEAQTSVEALKLIHRGWINRRVGETAMNRDSSRSHAMLIIEITTEELIGTMVTRRNSTLNLVDLAGSERQSRAKTTGDRFKEATHINSSLSVLGRVIRTLAKGDANTFVPYRESHLTHILKNSLGGNSRTSVIVNVHAAKEYIAETLSTLQFAEACSMIRNKIVVNEDMTGDSVDAYKAQIRQLLQEQREVEERLKKKYEEELAVAGEETRQWKNLADERSVKMAELRTNLECKMLVNCTSGKQEEAEKKITNILMERCRFLHKSELTPFQETINDLLENISTLRVELEETKSRLSTKDAERIQMANRFDNVLSELKSPVRLSEGTPSRRKSRNPRRETLYTPSRSIFQPVLHIPEVEDLKENVVSQEMDELRQKSLEMQIECEKFALELQEKERGIEELSQRVIYKDQELQKANAKFAKREAELLTKIARQDQEIEEREEAVHIFKKHVDVVLQKLMAEQEKGKKLTEDLQRSSQEIIDLEEKNQELQNELTRQLALQEEIVKQKVSEFQEHRQAFERTKEMADSMTSSLTEELAAVRLENLAKDKALRDCIEALESARDDALIRAEKAENDFENANNDKESLKKLLRLKEEEAKKMNIDHEQYVQRVKKRLMADVRDKTELVEKERDSHAKTRVHYEKLQSDLNDKFERKMSEMQRNFESSTEERYAEYRNRQHETEAAYSQKSEELSRTIAELESLRLLHEEDSRTVEGLAGHQNPAQKIIYLNSQRTKISELQRENEQLKAMLKTAGLDRSMVEAPKASKRVTRSSAAKK